MAKKQGRRLASELDWYYISSRSLTKVVVGFLLLTAAVVAGTYFIVHQDERDTKRAKQEIAEAERNLAEAKEHPDARRYGAELSQVERSLNDARTAFAGGLVDKAIKLAVESQSSAKRLLGGKATLAQADATVVDRAGRVEMQRANESTWRQLEVSSALYEGDFIKTGPNGTAEVMSSDGTLYRIKPETLFEVHRTSTIAGASGAFSKRSEAKVVVGSTEVNTGEGGQSVVKTDAATTDIAKNSSVGLDNDTRATGVSTFRGEATLTSSASGKSVTLRDRERAVATKDGIGEKLKLLEPPAPFLPDDNSNFDIRKRDPITLRWTPVKDTRTYHLQIAQSRLFVPDSIIQDDKSRVTSEAILQVKEPGSYYWRVKAIGKINNDSEWSPVRRIRATAGGLQDRTERIPPELVLQRPQVMGNLVIVIGKTEPGATVTVNNEQADPDADGKFRKTISVGEGFQQILVKAQNGAGLETIKRESVVIQTY